MMSFLGELFRHGFMVRALLVGGLVSLCAALLGVSLVLKRYSMIGDGLSHVGFGTLALALSLEMVLPASLSLPSPLFISMPVVMLAAVLLLRLSDNSKIKGDAAIALLSSSALAIGIIAVSLTTGMNVDVYGYLFGSILSTTTADLYTSIFVAAVVIGLFVFFYNRIFAVTFDETFARASGVKAGRYNVLIALLTALIIVVGMRMMGAMLISCLIIFPALTSMRVFKSFRSVVISSAIVSVFCFVTGILLSFAVGSLPSGATVVVVNLATFLLFSLVGALLRHTSS
jgi:zinc transport system permease protein